MTLQTDPKTDGARPSRGMLDDLIGRKVIRSLGSPKGFLDVQVRPLWGEHYRVNVRVGPSVTLARIANSFFLTADAQGNILASSPAIARLY
jgi:hypothetical protein